jgi:hypothetical protein
VNGNLGDLSFSAIPKRRGLYYMYVYNSLRLIYPISEEMWKTMGGFFPGSSSWAPPEVKKSGWSSQKG